MRIGAFLGWSCLMMLAGTAPAADASLDRPRPEKGTVRFEPIGDVKAIPERYRLDRHTFDYHLEHQADLPSSGVTISHLSFPSPVETDCPENNIVHALYYRPVGEGPFPAVVILDVTAGDQTLSRAMGAHLAHHRIAGLFVQMAYYGPRRPAGSKLRLLSTNVAHTMDAIRQTVLDIRRASAWLASRPEVDAKRIGIIGTSLGSMIGALAAEMEPRFHRVAVLLGGGGLVDAYYNDPRGATFRKVWEALGGNKEKLAKIIAPVDPLTCAANLRDRQVLIMAGKRDEIIPPRCAEALWDATGKQEIVWFDCTHYGAVLYVMPAMDLIVKHFRAE